MATKGSITLAIVVALGVAWLAPRGAVGQQNDQSSPDSGEGTLITLHVDSGDPREVLAEVGKQANVAISPPPAGRAMPGEAAPRVTLSLDNVPFWTAMAQYCQQTHLTPAIIKGRSGEITLAPANGDDQLGGVVCTSGLFEVVATGIQHSRVLQFDGSNTVRDDCVQLAIYADPQVRLLRYPYVALDVANDENGNSLLVTPEMLDVGHARFVASCAWGAQVNAPILIGTDHGRKLAELQGTFSLTCATQVQELVVENVTHSGGGALANKYLTLTVDSCALNGNQGSVQVTAERPRTGNRIPLPVESLITDAVRLVGEDGHEQALDLTPGPGDSYKSIWTCTFSSDVPLKEPVKLVWTAATDVKVMQVPFEFKDLRLPRD
jgi:hypothetical protein